MSENTAVELENLLERQKKQVTQLERLQNRVSPQSVQQTSEDEPVYDLYQKDNEIYLSIDLPGLFENQIQFQLKSNRFIISGTYPELVNVEGSICLQRNRKTGTFEYSFFLSSKLQSYEVQQENGILFIKLILAS